MNLMSWIGLGVMIGSEAATLARMEPFWSWNTPIAWTGFILFADGIVWQARAAIVDPIEWTRVHSAGARIDSAVARLRRLQLDHS